MDLRKILEELRGERELLEEAVRRLEILARLQGKKHRGRPPKWLVEARKERASKERKSEQKAA